MIENKNVLILGNGFDLSCKLASSYKDFYEKRYSDEFIKIFYLNNYIEDYSEIEDSVIANYGILDFILLASSNLGEDLTNWADVETVISNFFNEENILSINKIIETYIQHERETPNNDFFFSIDNLEEKIFDCHVDTSDLSVIEQQEILNELNQMLVIELLYKKNILYDELFDVDFLEKILLLSFLENLKDIENEFKLNLQLEVEKENSNYPSNTIKLFESFDIKVSETYLINFNYTILDSLNYNAPFYERNHVHGQIGTNREIIFGIDENSLDLESPYYSFTKTYRKLVLDSKRANPYKKLPTEISNLVFYGHSLGEADFAYFYSLFDFYEIYNSKVNIIFYFNDYIEDDDYTVLNNYATSITSLFNNYSQNSNLTTKNLLHKLNLEGRVHIREIKIKYDKDKIINTSIV